MQSIPQKKYSDGVKRPGRPPGQIKPFRAAYNRLPKGDAVEVSEVIIKRAKIANRCTFCNYKNGNWPMTEKTIEVVQAVFRCYGLDAWTGEKFINQ